MLKRTVGLLNPEIERLVESLLPQARSEAWRRFSAAPQQLELDEMISLAYSGLMMAASRWPLYCQEHNFDSGCGQVPCVNPESCGTRFFAAYALRRMRGNMLDAMRSSDWVTRSTRSRAKRLREAGQDLGKTEAQLAEATGMTARQVRDTLAGVARRPVSVDSEPLDVQDSDDVEGTAAVNLILDATVRACQQLPREGQIVMALHYHQGRDLKDIAEELGRSAAYIQGLHDDGLLAIHDAMLREAGD